MIRFVDLRPTQVDASFAFWDTVRDEFITCAGEQAWDSWEDFRDYLPEDQSERYRRLCPDWAFRAIKPNKALVFVDTEGEQQLFLAEIGWRVERVKMTQYEYTKDMISESLGQEEEKRHLEERGLDGWELCSVVKYTVLGSDRRDYYFKRQINGDPTRL